MRADVLLGGKYRLVRAIGAGGMGSVWLARNEMTEREFAIKFLHAHAAQSPKMIQRFFQEARVSGKLRHPSLLEIFDVGTAPELQGAPYLVMELLDGAPLDAVIRKLGKLPVGLALELAATVARAVALAHDKGIVHRDLKPANVFLHKPGTGAVVPKVLDFGISKIMTQPAMGPSLGLTQTGAVLGSPLYMSPEQVESSEGIDARSDVYSLGVVLWECIAGRVPYKSNSYNLLVVEKLAPERRRLRDFVPEVSEELDALVAKAIARDRDERIASARDLATSLDAIRASMGIATILDRPTAAQWLFAQLGAISSIPPPLPETQVETSTTGAVSVPRSAMPSAPSPSAYTFSAPGSRADSRPEDAFAITALAEPSRPAPSAPMDSAERAAERTPVSRAVTGDRADPRTGDTLAAGTRPKPRPRVALYAAAAGVFALACVTAWRLASPPAAPVTAAIAPTPAVSPSVASAAVSPAAAPPARAAAAPAPLLTATAAPEPPAPAPRPAASPSPARPSRPAPRAKADAGAPPPNRGIVDDGL